MKKNCNKKFVPQSHFAKEFFFLPILDEQKFELNLQKSAKIFCLEISRNCFIIMQSGYGEQTLSYEIFLLLLKKFRPFSDFTFESEVL